MAGSIPDLRGQIAALVSGIIPLNRFMDWYFANWNTIDSSRAATRTSTS